MAPLKENGLFTHAFNISDYRENKNKTGSFILKIRPFFISHCVSGSHTRVAFSAATNCSVEVTVKGVVTGHKASTEFAEGSEK